MPKAKAKTSTKRQKDLPSSDSSFVFEGQTSVAAASNPGEDGQTSATSVSNPEEDEERSSVAAASKESRDFSVSPEEIGQTSDTSASKEERSPPPQPSKVCTDATEGETPAQPTLDFTKFAAMKLKYDLMQTSPQHTVP